MRFGFRVRRLLHLLVVIGTALVLGAPMLLGPGAAGNLHELVGSEHRCACGMKAGQCGCPECERLEAQRRHDAEQLRGHAVLRASCDDDGVPFVGARLHVALAPSLPLPTPGVEERTHFIVERDERSLDRPRPPTPPPRRDRMS